jgi:hypothetical protein
MLLKLNQRLDEKLKKCYNKNERINLIMAKKTYTIEKKDPTHTQVWEWNETPELVKLLKELHTNKSVSSTGSNNPVV